MSNSSDPKYWSDDQIIEYLRSYWKCEDFVFDCKIDDKPYKTSRPENFKGSITNISVRYISEALSGRSANLRLLRMHYHQ